MPVFSKEMADSRDSISGGYLGAVGSVNRIRVSEVEIGF
jgi:hypothetical protein